MTGGRRLADAWEIYAKLTSFNSTFTRVPGMVMSHGKEECRLVPAGLAGQSGRGTARRAPTFIMILHMALSASSVSKTDFVGASAPPPSVPQGTGQAGAGKSKDLWSIVVQ
jgi:hypothetical protein